MTDITYAVSGICSFVFAAFSWLLMFAQQKQHTKELADKDSFIEKLMDRLQSKDLREYKVHHRTIERPNRQRHQSLTDHELAAKELGVKPEDLEPEFAMEAVDV